MIQNKKIKTVGIFGFSMGAATSILAMSKDSRIKAGLFSSGYASAVDVMSDGAQRDFSLPRFPLVDLGIWVANVRGDMNLNEVIPEQKIGSISPRPIFIMHCDQDEYVDFSHAKRLFAAAKEPKKLWKPKCDKHEHIWNMNKEESQKLSIEFFKKNLVY